MGRAPRVSPQYLAVKLRAIREALKLTAEELIRALDCPAIPLYRATIHSYETGKREPPLPVLLRYARLANLALEVLIDDELRLPPRLRVKDLPPQSH